MNFRNKWTYNYIDQARNFSPLCDTGGKSPFLNSPSERIEPNTPRETWKFYFSFFKKILNKKTYM